MGFISLTEGLEIGSSSLDQENLILSTGVETESLFESALEKIMNEEASYREAVSKDPFKLNKLTVTGVINSAVKDITDYVDRSLCNMSKSGNSIDDLAIGSTIYEYSITKDIPLYMDKERDAMYKELDSVKEALSMDTTTSEKIEIIRSARKQILEKCNANFWDKYRGKLIDSSPIHSDSFGRELFKVYRSNGKRIKVTEARVKEAKKNVRNKTAINQILSEKKNIVKQYDVLQERFDRVLNLRNVRNLDSKAEDLQLEMDMYFATKANQLNKMKNLHLIAYTAKLDAIVEQYKVDQTLARLEV